MSYPRACNPYLDIPIMKQPLCRAHFNLHITPDQKNTQKIVTCWLPDHHMRLRRIKHYGHDQSVSGCSSSEKLLYQTVYGPGTSVYSR